MEENVSKPTEVGGVPRGKSTGVSVSSCLAHSGPSPQLREASLQAEQGREQTTRRDARPS